MDSQSTVDHLRDEANARKDTTLGDLLDTAAEELDQALDELHELNEFRSSRALFLSLVERYGERWVMTALESLEATLKRQS